MGPVSFEAVDLGPDRERAMALAAAARAEGFRVEVVMSDGRHRLMVRHHDAAAVRALVDGGDTGGVTALAISPLDRPPDVTVRVPGSKSHTNRALICAALARGRSVLDGVLLADDTEAMLDALVTLGFGVDLDREARRVEVEGGGGVVPAGPAVVDARQSGTTSRFLVPLLALGSGTYVLDGHDQMRARPFDDLIAALHSLGARIEGSALPLTVHADPGAGLRGGSVSLPGSVSSQFLSAVLLSAPCATDATEITIDGDLVSRPYIDLTVATMRRFGAVVDTFDHDRYVVAPTGYDGAEITIEPDASAASYFFAAAAITGGRVTVEGLGTDTIQGDIAFVDLLERMGATVERTASSTTVAGGGPLRGIDVDMADISDTAQSLAVIAPFAEGPTRVRGIGFIRRKETDRIAAVVEELRRLGVDAVEDPDGFTIHPSPPSPGRVHTYDDHRMAMSFALLGLAVDGIELDDPGCVAKTFPDYFEVLDQLR